MLGGLTVFFKIITQGPSPKVILVRTAKAKRMSNLQDLQAAPGSQLLWVTPQAGVDFHHVVVFESPCSCEWVLNCPPINHSIGSPSWIFRGSLIWSNFSSVFFICLSLPRKSHMTEKRLRKSEPGLLQSFMKIESSWFVSAVWFWFRSWNLSLINKLIYIPEQYLMIKMKHLSKLFSEHLSTEEAVIQ